MARGGSDRRIALLVAGGVDTKVNPKLVQPPGLLELENMYQLRTGELRPRNGCSKMSATSAIGSGDNLFSTLNGGIGSIARNWKSLTGYPTAVKYGTSGTTGWEAEVEAQASGFTWFQHPTYTALVTGVTQMLSTGTAVGNSVDPDMFDQNSYRVVGWSDGGAQSFLDVRETVTGRTAPRWGRAAFSMQTGGSFKVAAAGSNQSAVFWPDAGTTLKAIGWTGTGGTSSGVITLTATLHASMYFDVKPIPNTGNFAVAYREAAGGVTCGIFNPSAGTFTSTVTTAGADATLALGWMDDTLATGNSYLITAGTASGVVVRTMTSATMVVTATDVIDATATANIRNVTGHTNTGAANYVVLWDVTAANPIDDSIQQGLWTGAAAVRAFARGQSLYSRSHRFPDGNYHVLATVTSTVQPCYFLLPCDKPGVIASGSTTVAPVCVALSGEGAGRRLPSSLASPVTASGSVAIAVSRNRKISTPAGDVVGGNLKTAAVVTFTDQPKVRSRELGGTVFISGGLLYMDDGGAIQPATFPTYPEVPTGVASNAGGSMTALGAYTYRTVWKTFDASGRICRSAGSVPFAITLGAADNRVTLTLTATSIPLRGAFMNSIGKGFGIIFGEVYRRGPAASGATTYNKVGEVQVGTSSPITFVDTMSDATAAQGQVAYFSGNVLENFHPPSHSLLEVNGNRVGIVNAEDPTEFWYSKEYKAGAGIGFNPLLKVRISGDGFGGMTALGAMDGRWILFKRSAIYVMSGDGPNDLGQGSFNAPQAISRTVGTINPSSVVETPEGIMFQATTGGIWLIDRGLNVQYIGKDVEAYTTAVGETLAGASLVTGIPAVRFVMSGGRCLEWDYYHKRWNTHLLRVDRSGVASFIVDCVNSTLHGWCYLLDNGDLMQEVANQNTDVNGTTTGVVPRVSFPHIQAGGLAGHQRLDSIDFTIEAMGNCTLSVDAEYDHSGALTGVPKTFAITAGATYQVQYTPPEGKAKNTSCRPVVTVSGSPTGGTFRLTSATASVRVKRGSDVTEGNRMT